MNLQQLSPVVLNWLLNLLAAGVALALPFVIPPAIDLIKAKVGQMEANTTSTNQQAILFFVRESGAMVVKAAEQYFGSGRGKEKKEWAVEALQNLLVSHGITSVDVPATEAAVEASVFAEIHNSKPDPNKVGTAPAADTPAVVPVTGAILPVAAGLTGIA